MEYTDEQIIAAIDAAPVPVQETLRSSDTNKALADIGAAHNLHIDQIGDLAEINRNLLVGLVAPAEMYGELVEIGVSADEARQIMSEINTKIFVPLREKMRSSTEDSPTTAPAPLPKPAPVSQAQPLPQYPAAPLQQEHVTRPLSGLAPQVAPPALLSPAPHTQVFTPASGWPGAPAGNWQPAAAVHVYVPGPAPVHPQMVAPATPPAQQPIYTPASVEELPIQPTRQPEQVVRTVRPIPAPPPNLPGTTPERPLEKNYVADPYREQPL